MKYFSLISFLLLFILSSCTNDTVEEVKTTICSPNIEAEYPIDQEPSTTCISDICTEYLPIWEELFKEKNNIDQDFFDAYIEVGDAGINEWDKGTSFYVCYQLQIDWAIANKCDKFIININPDNNHYPALDLPRDTNLNKDEIRMVTENRAFSSSMANLNSVAELEYISFESALENLIEFSGVNTLCFLRLVLDKDSGNLTLHALGEYENEENLCISGSIDLITGEKNIFDHPCRI